MDGPFTETKELVAGYWLWQVKSMDEAVEWVRRCPDPMRQVNSRKSKIRPEGRGRGLRQRAHARAPREAGAAPHRAGRPCKDLNAMRASARTSTTICAARLSRAGPRRVTRAVDLTHPTSAESAGHSYAPIRLPMKGHVRSRTRAGSSCSRASATETMPGRRCPADPPRRRARTDRAR